MSDYRLGRQRSETDILSARLAANRVAPKSPAEALQPEAVPPPPIRSRAARHPLVVFLNFVMTIVVVGVLEEHNGSARVGDPRQAAAV